MRSFVHDLWAPLNHRADMGDGTSRPPNVPMWVPDDEARRMAAYRVQAALLDNTSRYYLPDVLWQRPTDVVTRDAITATVEIGKSPAEKFREYGDARLLVEQGVALVLGDTQEVVVPDAADLPDDAPDADKAAQARAAQFDEWLREWADTEGLESRLVEQEEDTVGLGDGVLVLGWDGETGRPRLRKYDVESYFPVLSGDQDVDEFPNKVHFAWVECDVNRNEWLHRLTYERRKLAAGETRTYRYADKPSEWAVFQTHGIWDLSRIRSDGLHNLSESTARYASTPDGNDVRDLDIGVDFMPIVHVPNTPSGGRHYGRSLLLSVAQILDDVAFADSDLAIASEVVGNTPVVTTGAGGGGTALDRGPGAEWRLPAGASAQLLDTSNTLKGQMGYVDHLLTRLSINTRIAEALLGRVKPNEVPSGYALGLGFAPTRSLVSKMRLVRKRKHPLILKFAMRLAQVAQVLPDGETPRAELHLGPYLPADVQAAIDQVKALLPAHAISLATAVQMLVNVGIPIDDAEAEVDRIRAEMFAEMVQLLEATGDETAVREMAGLPVSDQQRQQEQDGGGGAPAGGAPGPAPVLPPAPTGTGAAGGSGTQ